MTIFLWILAALACLMLLASYFLFRMACARSFRFGKKGGSMDASPLASYKPLFDEGRAWFANAPHERVHVRSGDGLELVGYFVPSGASRRTVLLMHGYRAKNGLADFGVILPYYHSLGLNLLVVDERACGESGGNYICFGVRERQDCAVWAEYLAARLGPDSSILLDGISMGAATVLMATGLPLPAQVRAVVADCGFTSAWDQCAYVARTMLRLLAFLLWPVDLWCRLLAGYSLRGASTLDALARNTRPVLFLHGKEDDFVPPSMTERNSAVCHAAHETYYIEGAGHGMSYLVETEFCRQKLRAFIERYLPE